MSDYEIVRGMGELPPRVSRRAIRFPLLELDVGDGVYLDRNEHSVRAQASLTAKTYGRKFATQKQHDGRILVVRVE